MARPDLFLFGLPGATRSRFQVRNGAKIIENGRQAFHFSLVQVGKTHLGSLLPGYRFYDGDDWLLEDLKEALRRGRGLHFQAEGVMEGLEARKKDEKGMDLSVSRGLCRLLGLF